MRRVYLILAVLFGGIVGPPGIAPVAHAQLSVPGTNDLLNRPRLERLPVERVRKTVDDTAKSAEATVDTTVDTVDGAVQTVVAAAGGLLLGHAPDGALIQMETIVALVDEDTLLALTGSGYQLQSSRQLDSLGLTLATIKKPVGASLPASISEIEAQHPTAVADYNHIYSYASADSSFDAGPTAAESAAQELPAREPDALSIGVIDSAITPEHRALQNIELIQRDFVTIDAERPTTHGTAIASLVVKSGGQGVTVHAASIFFQAPDFAPGATTESLIAALDWLVGQQVDVINMSLAGPGNKLLQLAIERIGPDGPVMIAAVGNNGPSSEPLYPAAYDGIIGVTAVDRERRVFRYANRGDYVDFAARGVNVKVADSVTGGYRIESGTSMASPHVAAVVAKMVRDGVSRPALISWLISGAEDLGKRGRDPIFGHGLISDPPLILSGD